MEGFDLKTLYTILHLFGVAAGAGGAYMSDLLFLQSISDRRLNKTELRFLHLGSLFVWGGIILLVISGALLFSLDPAKYLASSKFILKMIIVGIIIINGVILHKVHTPVLKRMVQKHLGKSADYQRFSVFMYISGALSMISWTLALILGALRSVPVTVGQGLVVYGCLVAGASIVALIKRRQFFK